MTLSAEIIARALIASAAVTGFAPEKVFDARTNGGRRTRILAAAALTSRGYGLAKTDQYFLTPRAS